MTLPDRKRSIPEGACTLNFSICSESNDPDNEAERRIVSFLEKPDSFLLFMVAAS